MKVRSKKTKTNHEFRINHLVIPAVALKPILARFGTKKELVRPPNDQLRASQNSMNFGP
jgi:hypothetical protein